MAGHHEGQGMEECGIVMRKVSASSIQDHQMGICEMMIVLYDHQPFPMVEDIGFRQLMQFASLRYALPSRTTFSRHVVFSLFQVCRDTVKTQLAWTLGYDAHFISDIWRS